MKLEDSLKVVKMCYFGLLTLSVVPFVIGIIGLSYDGSGMYLKFGLKDDVSFM